MALEYGMQNSSNHRKYKVRVDKSDIARKKDPTPQNQTENEWKTWQKCKIDLRGFDSLTRYVLMEAYALPPRSEPVLKYRNN